jgi:hypothetical protein
MIFTMLIGLFALIVISGMFSNRNTYYNRNFERYPPYNPYHDRQTPHPRDWEDYQRERDFRAFLVTVAVMILLAILIFGSK